MNFNKLFLIGFEDLSFFSFIEQELDLKIKECDSSIQKANDLFVPPLFFEELDSVFCGDEIFKNLTKIVNLYPFSKFIISLNPEGWEVALQASKIISKDPLLHRFILSKQVDSYPTGVDYSLSDFDSEYLMLVDKNRKKSEIIEFISP
tara:strand:- start:419 stop:862 length:444 start_codon:yes stop_codon:yes gene_type:complete